MKHRATDFRPGDRVQVCWGVKDGDRDMSCRHCRIISVVNDGTANVGLHMVDSDNRLVLLGANQVTFIAHQGVA